ncbi:MAG TPA: 50S ribosomal protein L23 [Candidatus Nanoarchaeia archaeon]|nr:50S ribosomal protein L23 [Candidatus Nanoarchaeia archaeon]
MKKTITLRPLITEKAVMLIESNNVLTFETEKERNKDEIKKEVESTLSVKVDKIQTLIKDNKKYAYVKLKKEFPAMDLATKLGMI